MDDSPFGKLAPELRNTMFELVLCLGKPITVIIEDSNTPRAEDPPAVSSTPALTTMCRQIRRETLPVFYGVNRSKLQVMTFKLPDLSDDELSEVMTMRHANASSSKAWPPALLQWFGQIGADNARSLRRVDILLGDWYPAHAANRQAASALPSILGPLARFFRNTKTVCTVVVHVLMKDDWLELYCEAIRLPFTNQKQATEALNKWWTDPKLSLKRVSLGTWPGFNAQVNVNFNALRVLLAGIKVAALDEDNVLF